jgi:dihydrolipoamide dehydrogenase
MPKKDYNLIVIGAGAAGLSSAYIAATLKAKVALIEKHRMGGDCLNTGCVPSKALIRSTRILSYIKRHKDFGIRAASATYDFKEIMDRVRNVVRKVAPHDSVERYSKLGVDCYSGEAKIISPHEVKVAGKTFTTQNIIIATGARPFVPQIAGIDTIPYLTSDTVWDLETLPQKLVVAGGGPIGCELTQCFARLGSQVTQIEMLPGLLFREDEEYGQAIEAQFAREGIHVRTNTRCKEVVAENGGQTMIAERDGKVEKTAFDQLLLAVGRTPSSKGFGLEEIGVNLTKRGEIEVDEYMRTTHKNIFACGDVAGPYQFTHTASHQAWYCAVNALFGPWVKFKINYQAIPWCTFTDPEVARVGLSENEAREKGIPYETTCYSLADLDRAIADGEDHGNIKVLTVPGKDKILGATIMGYHAGDLIAEYVTAMRHGLGLDKILSTIHIYPTMSEANKYAAGEWKKSHVSENIFNLLRKVHDWKR